MAILCKRCRHRMIDHQAEKGEKAVTCRVGRCGCILKRPGGKGG